MADLRRSVLRGANLTKTWMASTAVRDLDLSGSKGLESVRHYGPSTIGIDTIYRSQIGEQLVGFANADGGDLLIGVEDDGKISGVPHTQEEVQALLSAPGTHVFAGQILPLLHAVSVELDYKRVIFFSVSKGSSQIYQLPDGRCVRRRDTECVPITFADIQFERQEISKAYRSRDIFSRLG
jgi:predicted HTH transcriptional regulator